MGVIRYKYTSATIVAQTQVRFSPRTRPKLRARAAKCRALSRLAKERQLASQYLDLADSYERMASAEEHPNGSLDRSTAITAERTCAPRRTVIFPHLPEPIVV